MVAIQFGGLLAIALTGPIIAGGWVLGGIEFSGIALGIWAILAMGRGNLNISPLVKEDNRLVMQGPYRLIRHPMYTATLMVIIPLLINHFSWIRLGIVIILLINYILKLNFEESLLKRKHQHYDEYRKSTYRLLPYIF